MSEGFRSRNRAWQPLEIKTCRQRTLLRGMGNLKEKDCASRTKELEIQASWRKLWKAGTQPTEGKESSRGLDYQGIFQAHLGNDQGVAGSLIASGVANQLLLANRGHGKWS